MFLMDLLPSNSLTFNQNAQAHGNRVEELHRNFRDDLKRFSKVEGSLGGLGFSQKNRGSKSNGRRFFPFWIGEIRSKRSHKFITGRIHQELKSPKV